MSYTWRPEWIRVASTSRNGDQFVTCTICGVSGVIHPDEPGRVRSGEHNQRTHRIRPDLGNLFDFGDPHAVLQPGRAGAGG